MAAYLVRRMVQSVVILVGVTVITFALLYALPADPARMIAGRSATVETVQRIRAELGLDQPLPVQYARYVSRLVRGDLGRSYAQKIPVADLLWSRLPATALLMAGGIAFELLIGLPAGMLAALRRRSRLDQLVMVAAFVGVSAPQFVVGLFLLYWLAYRWGLFPLGGYGTPAHLILPAFALGVAGGGWYARVMRSSMLDVIHQDYVRTARAKGLSEPRVVVRHAVRNALLPVVSMVGLDIGTFMGGVVVVETVFSWPGIGQLAWQAIQIVDIPVIMGVVVVSALAITTGNLLADLVYPLLDPKIRYG
ncbi:MAG: ABC transporter permease [Armatimonadota bacterium]|nr:ABC transporter permease [Armatimonadota bacterium]MDR7437176.1 ABC transporter permease [Armatimonadota bacterium]MDR7473225.1 ABC transporter permease [Armatimonadota bacterium]MDR7507381.1 ABC transporter permease [Armatimonadota bacterium]MDR7509678.1 ABC transporter permease [Armatimonadota bacterium]